LDTNSHTKLSLLRAGSLKDVFYKLLTFGIPDQVLPLTAEGEPKIKYHRQWLKCRRQQEDSSSSSDTIIVVPCHFDILSGRGKPIQEHFGNVRYHALLDYYQQAYERSKKFDKMQIAQRILQTVHDYSGRFLKQEGAGWSVVDDLVAREKVSHAFRTRRTMLAKQQGDAATSITTTRVSKRTADGSEVSSSEQFVVQKRLSDAPAVTSGQFVKATRASKQSELSEPVVPAKVTSGATEVTDTEAGGSSSSEDDYDGMGGKRMRVWASTFHEVETLQPKVFGTILPQS
jgi:hypothetical protein